MITANRITYPQPTADGWFGKLSPNGRYLAFGNMQTWVHDLHTGQTNLVSQAMNTAHAAHMGWLDNRFLGILDHAKRAKDLWLYDAQERVTRLRHDLGNPDVLYDASFFEMRDGHWASSVSAPPFPLVWDGRRLNDSTGQPAMGYGLSVNGPWLVAANRRDERYSLMRYYCGEYHSEFQPVVDSPFFFINERGDITYGYTTQRINYVTGIDEDATITPWRSEGVGVSLYVDGELWVVQPLGNGGRFYTMARRIQDTYDDGAILIDCPTALGFPHNPNLSVAYNNGEFVVAMTDATGRVGVTRFRKNEPRDVLALNIPRVDRPLTMVSFHQFSDQYGDDPDYPAHATVVSERGQACVRAARRMPIIITEAVLNDAVPVADRVMGLYIGDTGGWRNAERLAQDFKSSWRSRTGRTTPLFWYITTREAEEPGFRVPDSVDVVCPEMYYPQPGNLREQTWRKVGWWVSKIGRSKPWMPVFQSYDRSVWSAEHMQELVAVTPYFLELTASGDTRIGATPPNIGMMFFTVMRPGGVTTYPMLRPVHQAIFNAIPGPAPLPTPARNGKPEITIRDYQPKAGPAPLKVTAVAARTNDVPVQHFEWLYRPVGTTTWIRDSRVPESDTEHTFTFSHPETYEIKLVAHYDGGTVETGAERLVEVKERGGDMAGDIPHIGDSEIIELADLYIQRRPREVDNSEVALFRDAAYYAWGYFGLRAQGRSHAQAMQAFGDTVAANDYYNNPTSGTRVPALTDDEIIDMSAHFLLDYRNLGVFQRQNFQENMRDQSYYLRNYLVYRQQRRSHSHAVILMVRDMYRDFGQQPPMEEPIQGGGSDVGSLEFEGRISVNGRLFHSAAGPWRMRFTSALTILKKNDEDLHRFLDWTVSTGFNGIRVFAGALPWANQTPEDARARLPYLLEQCRARSLYCEVTALTDTKTGYDKRQHVQYIASLCNQFDNTLLELANEHHHATQDEDVHDPEYLMRLRRELVPAHVMTAIGAPDYDEPQNDDGRIHWPEPVADYTTLHLRRHRIEGGFPFFWNNIRRIRELEAVGSKTGKPVVDNERIGADEAEIHGKRVNDPMYFFAAGVLDRLFEVNAVHHSQHGLMAELPGPVQQACAEAFIRGFNVIKTRARLHFKNTGWGDSPVADANFVDDEGGGGGDVIRVYSGLADDGSENVLVIVGLRAGGDPGLRMKNGWQLGEVLDEMSSERGTIRVHRLVR